MYSKIFLGWNTLQDLVAEIILMVGWVSLADGHGAALVWVEVHQPSFLPAFKVFQIILQDAGVPIVGNRGVEQAIICK